MKVRVAVAVDRCGEWNAAGYSGASDAVAKAGTGYDGSDALYWLTAELPIPEDVTVQASVEGGE